MIGYLRGRLVRSSGEHLVLDVGGVGYLVSVPTTVRERIGKVGDEVEVHIHTHVREDILALFGFGSVEELEFFKMLIEVDGVGPKVALGILGSSHIGVLKRAILAEDPALIRRAPGVGAKTAAKVIIDLKSKLEGDVTLLVEPKGGGHALGLAQQTETALRGLGYTQQQAREAIEGIDWGEATSVQGALTSALKLLGQR